MLKTSLNFLPNGVFSKILFCLSLFTLLTNTGNSQERDPVSHTSSTVSSTSRYEIIQSSLAARWTFRLDRVCGGISQLVQTPSEDMTFEKMDIISLPKCTADGKIRYQLFTSGLAARLTFLLNTDSGKAWQLQSWEDKDGVEHFAWVPFD